MTTRGQSFEIDRKTAKQTSQTLFRGLKILELTASGKSNVSIRELAKEANLPRSIVLPMLFYSVCPKPSAPDQERSIRKTYGCHLKKLLASWLIFP
jgi:hypothetical protein